MLSNVIKRDGTIVQFDKNKIINAILKAYEDIYEEIADNAVFTNALNIASDIEEMDIEEGNILTVEDIQDLVEEALMDLDKPVAKSYINYRFLHGLARNEYDKLMDAIKEKLMADNVQNQNANVDEKSFGGRVGEASDLVNKRFALEYLVSPTTRKNHEENMVYIHDLSAYPVGSHNCTDGDSWVIIKDNNGEIKTRKIKDVAEEIGLESGQIADLTKTNYQILSRDGWTKLNKVTKRKLKENESIFEIKTRTGLPLKLTGNHRLPVNRNQKEEIIEVKDLKVGDELISVDSVTLSAQEINKSFIDLTKLNTNNIDIRIFNLSPLKQYLRFKYGIILGVWGKTYLKFFKNSQQVSLKLEDFLTIMDNFPISFEVLSQLRISASGSKHKYPLLIPYSPELAKLYAYIYSDGSVYMKEDGSLYQLMFANTNEDIVDDFIYCFESCFGRKLNKCYPSEEYKKNNSPCIRVHCGDKIIVKIFKDFANGLMDGSGNLKIPDFIINGTKEIKYAYLSAAIDSDGCMQSHNMNITTCCKEYCEQLVQIINSLGYHATLTKKDDKGSSYKFNYSNRAGIRNFDSYRVNLYRQNEMADLYTHMSTIKYCEYYSYEGISKKFIESKIVSIIEKKNLKIDVYDFETASHWFILNNYVSHNCMTVPFDDLLAKGFNTRQADVRPANSINTAFQLLAVVFQLQSLQQFGGVSAGHLDWTMVPYVRKSFYKHFRDGVQYIGGIHVDELEYEKYDKDFNLIGKYKLSNELPIDSEHYKAYEIKNELKNESAYTYAMDMTIKELEQAVEGMYHNLNTLQSRSGNQLNSVAGLLVIMSKNFGQNRWKTYK